MKKSLRAALAGILSALSVVFLYIGSVMWIFAYVMPLIAGLIMLIIIDINSKKLAFTVYAAVSIISLVLLPDKECVLIYVLFFGYYPMIKSSLDKLNNSLIKWILKLLIFNSAMVLTEIICIYAFGIPFENELGKWGIPILLVLSNAVFVMYERLMPVVQILYDKKLKSKIEKYLK